MSDENVRIAQASIAAWNNGDMDGLRDLYHPDATLRGLEGWPEPGPFVGRDAIQRQYALVYKMRRGLIFGVEFFRDYADALEATGIEE